VQVKRWLDDIESGGIPLEEGVQMGPLLNAIPTGRYRLDWTDEKSFISV
jgi:hypothetical protein